MKWIKKGKIFNVSGNYGWMNSHAQVPTVLLLEDRLRIFFGTRIKPGKSLIGFLDVAKGNLRSLLGRHFLRPP